VYETDETGTTTAWAGQGSLVAPTLVLVHPPLSSRIAAGACSARFRVGIVPSDTETTSSSFAEVIDVEGEPYISWKGDIETDRVIVALELGTPSQSPEYEVPGLESNRSSEDNFRIMAEHLKELAQSDWCFPARSGPEQRSGPEPELEPRPEPGAPEPEPGAPKPGLPEFGFPGHPPTAAPERGAPKINIACLIHQKFC
jgi:hypothetical protein